MGLILKRDMRHTFIDLYAGCGGFSLGLIQGGMKCIAAVEYAGDAALTYWYNLCMHGFSSLVADDRCDKAFLKAVNRFKNDPTTSNWLFPEPPDDYWTSSPDPSPALSLWFYDILKLEPEVIMQRYGFAPGELGVIVGGPPCQGFSLSNSKRDASDQRNQHPFRYMYFVEKFQPKYFLMENVPGMLTLGKKPGEKEGPFPKWIKEAGEKAGYHVEYEVHDCADYGVPQRRRRVIFSGTRNDVFKSSGAFQMAPPTHTWDYFDYYGEKGQLQMFKDPADRPKGEPYVDVFEAIGDLSSMKLSSWRSKDLIADKVPFGSMKRVGNSADDIVEMDGYYYYKDRFNGIYFARNHRDEISDCMDDRQHHYHRCPSCRKFNKKIRPACWHCDTKLTPVNP